MRCPSGALLRLSCGFGLRSDRPHHIVVEKVVFNLSDFAWISHFANDSAFVQSWLIEKERNKDWEGHDPFALHLHRIGAMDWDWGSQEWTDRLHLATLIAEPGFPRFEVNGMWYTVQTVTDTATLFSDHYYRRLVSIEERRTKLVQLPIVASVLYRPFVLLEFEGGYMMCAERYGDKVVVMFGPAEAIRSVAGRYNATGHARESSPMHHHAMVHNDVQLHQIEAWLHGYARVNQRCLFSSRSQHFAASLMRALSNGSMTNLSVADREVVLSSVEKNWWALYRAVPALRADFEVVRAAFDDSSELLPFLNLNFLKFGLRRWRALRFASPALRADRALVLAAVRQDGKALLYASPALRADREFVLSAGSVWALLFAAPALRGDREFVIAAVRRWSGRALCFAAPALHADFGLALAAVGKDLSGWECAAPALRADREFVIPAVRKRGLALKRVAPWFRNDREVVLAAVQQDGLALEYAEFWPNSPREVVLAAVQQNGLALKFTARRADREVVLAAVRQNRLAFEYAAPQLRADREVVLAAARQAGLP